MADSLNQVTAYCTASTIFLSGLLILIRNNTISALSPLLIDGGSNFLAHAGCNVFSSYCWHQAVGFPASFICVCKIHCMPLSKEAFNFFLRFSSIKLYCGLSSL